MSRNLRLLTQVVMTLVLVTGLSIGASFPAVVGSGAAQQQPAEDAFVIEDASVPALATNTTQVRITATIRNPGPAERTEEVDFRLEGMGRDIVTHLNVSIPGNSSQQLIYELDTSGFELGDYIVGITTRNSSQFAELEITNQAEIDFDPQESNGTAVEVSEVFLPRGGYVGIYNASSLANATRSDIIGVSGYLAPGFHEAVTFQLFDVPGATFQTNRLSEGQRLLAVSHQETNNTQTFDFVTSNGTADGPYLVDGTPVAEAQPVNVVVPP